MLTGEKIIERLNEYIASLSQNFPCRTNRASILGVPCERWLVYERTQWDNKKLPSLELQYIFEEGKKHEESVVNDLKKAGFLIFQQQTSFFLEKEEISGSFDFKIADPEDSKTAYICEAKAVSPNVFASLNTIEDFNNNWFYKRWLSQIQIYLYGAGTSEEKGFLVIKNRVSGRLKIMDIFLDYDYVDGLLKKAQRINEHIKNGTLPDQIEDISICSKCPFFHICLPEMVEKSFVEFIEDGTLEEKIKRWYDLKEARREYEKLDDEIKKIFEKKDKIIIGNFFITGKEISYTTYNIPEDIKKQYAKKEQYWKMKIEKILGEEL